MPEQEYTQPQNFEFWREVDELRDELTEWKSEVDKEVTKISQDVHTLCTNYEKLIRTLSRGLMRKRADLDDVAITNTGLVYKGYYNSGRGSVFEFKVYDDSVYARSYKIEKFIDLLQTEEARANVRPTKKEMLKTLIECLKQVKGVEWKTKYTVETETVELWIAFPYTSIEVQSKLYGIRTRLYSDLDSLTLFYIHEEFIRQEVRKRVEEFRKFRDDLEERVRAAYMIAAPYVSVKLLERDK